jgi:hypothetical protein
MVVLDFWELCSILFVPNSQSVLEVPYNCRVVRGLCWDVSALDCSIELTAGDYHTDTMTSPTILFCTGHGDVIKIFGVYYSLKKATSATSAFIG